MCDMRLLGRRSVNYYEFSTPQVSNQCEPLICLMNASCGPEWPSECELTPDLGNEESELSGEWKQAIITWNSWWRSVVFSLLWMTQMLPSKGKGSDQMWLTLSPACCFSTGWVWAGDGGHCPGHRPGPWRYGGGRRHRCWALQWGFCDCHHLPTLIRLTGIMSVCVNTEASLFQDKL